MNRVKLVKAEIGGDGLWLTFEAFDGQHTHIVKKSFDAGADQSEVLETMKELVKEIPVVPETILALVQTSVYSTPEGLVSESGAAICLLEQPKADSVIKRIKRKK